MATTKAEIDNFHQFALERLANRPDAAELDELLVEWYDTREREEVHEIIRIGIADIEAGRGRDAFEFTQETLKKYQIPVE